MFSVQAAARAPAQPLAASLRPGPAPEHPAAQRRREYNFTPVSSQRHLHSIILRVLQDSSQYVRLTASVFAQACQNMTQTF